MKEQIAQLSDASVNVHRVIGRDEYGTDIEVKVPTRLSVQMLARNGSEHMIPVQCGRTVTAECTEGYQAQRMRDLIREGWIPVHECPHTLKYEELVNGPLAAPPAGVEACRGARPSSARYASQQAHEEGAKIKVWRPGHEPEMVIPCEHYFAHRARLRERTAEDARIRKLALKAPPSDEIKQLAQSIASMAKGAPDISKARARLRGTKGDE